MRKKSEYNKFVGNTVTEASNGFEAVELCKNKNFDLVILDIMMPGLDGFSALKEIRKFKAIPAIMLSARGEEYDKLHGFEIGADDYIVKPFSPRELLARQKAVLKRYEKESGPYFKIEGLEIDFNGRKVIIDGSEIVLTPKEYEILFYLVKNRGIAISREKMLKEIWGYDYFGDDRTVDTHIKMLRANLGKYRDLIVTLRGLGYKFTYEKD